MESRSLYSCLTLCVAFAIVALSVATHCEASSEEKAKNGRFLFQASPSPATASSASAAAATAATASDGGAASAAAAGAASAGSGTSATAATVSAATSTTGGPTNAAEEPAEERDVVCSKCPEEKKCDVCCCVTGECVDPVAASKGEDGCPRPKCTECGPVTAQYCIKKNCKPKACKKLFWFC